VGGRGGKKKQNKKGVCATLGGGNERGGRIHQLTFPNLNRQESFAVTNGGDDGVAGGGWTSVIRCVREDETNRNPKKKGKRIENALFDHLGGKRGGREDR